MPSGPASVWYRLLIALHPRSFRERFGAEMYDTVARMTSLRESFHWRERWRIWRFLSRDLLASAVREHIAELRSPRTASAPPSLDQRPMTPGVRMNTLLQDLRYAVRTLRRSPGFALTVIISLAIGIGANTLVYSLVEGIVLRPFPWPDPDRLVAVGVRYQGDPGRQFIESLSPAEYDDIRGSSRTLERFFAFDLGNRAISGGDFPERVFTAFLWGDPFSTIGMRPALGRGFTEAETMAQGSDAAILSHRVWQSRFAGDTAVIGRVVHVNGQPRTVVGVMPPGLLLLGTDLWLPMGVSPSLIPRAARQYAIVARVRHGSTLAEVDTDLSAIAGAVARTWEAQHPEYRQWSLGAARWADVMSEPARPAALVMLGAVAFVLLLACANIASVMLARATARQREMAVRSALGARTHRLARQLITESVLLALAGAALGVGLAAVLIGPMTGLFPEQITTLGIAGRLDWRVLVATLGIALAVGLLTSLAPVVQVARRRRIPGLAAAGRSVTGSRGDRRLRQAFTVAQIGFAVLLLSGATVMLRSMNRLQRIDPGFDTGGLLTMRLSLPLERYTQAEIGPFFENLARELTVLPGVEHAAAATQFPPRNVFDATLATEELTSGDGVQRTVDVTNVTPDLPATLGLRLLAGRVFDGRDNESSPRVALLNQTAARRYFASGTAVGRRVGLAAGNDTLWHEVVGIVSDTRNQGVDAAVAPEVFVPVRQQAVAWNNQLFLIIRTSGDPLTHLPAVREVIRRIDPQQPVYLIRTMESVLAETLATRRAATLLLTVFGLVALLLAAVGIYGILSYLVNVRTHEIGVRLALGADERRVAGLVLRETAWLVGLGVAIGVAGSAATRGLIGRLAFEVASTDLVTMGASVAILCATALLACLVPARRAARVMPVEALRIEG